MGYRSNWRIVFNTHKKSEYVLDALTYYVANNRNADGAALIDDMIRESLLTQTEHTLIMEETGWKLSEWDDVKQVLHDLFDHDPEIDFATIRLGEEADDNEIESGNYTYVCMDRFIGDNYLDPVPPAKQIQSPPIKSNDKCKCDIHQLMIGNGHDSGCPEGH